MDVKRNVIILQILKIKFYNKNFYRTLLQKITILNNHKIKIKLDTFSFSFNIFVNKLNK